MVLHDKEDAQTPGALCCLLRRQCRLSHQMPGKGHPHEGRALQAMYNGAVRDCFRPHNSTANSMTDHTLQS
jgi:hypothetical protein